MTDRLLFFVTLVCSYYSWVLIGVQNVGGAIGDKITAPWSIIILFPFAYFLLANGLSLRDRMFRDLSLFKFGWVSANPMVWQKTHALAGKMSVFVGLVLFVIAVLNDFKWHTNWIYLIAFAVWLVFAFIVVLIYSRVISRDFEQD